jgi:hypothetical protein
VGQKIERKEGEKWKDKIKERKEKNDSIVTFLARQLGGICKRIRSLQYQQID